MFREMPTIIRTKIKGDPARTIDNPRDHGKGWCVVLAIPTLYCLLTAVGILPVKLDGPQRTIPVSWMFVACYSLLIIRIATRKPPAETRTQVFHQARDVIGRRVLFDGINWVLFIAPLNYLAVSAGPNGYWLFYVLAIFDVIAFILLGYAFYLHLRYVKYGQAVCTFAPVQPQLDSLVTACFTTERPLGRCQELNFTLRCVERAIEITQVRRSRGRTEEFRKLQLYQVWGQTLRIANGQFDTLDQQFELSFQLPTAEELRQVTTGHFRFWELEVTSVSKGIPFHAFFPLQVQDKWGEARYGKESAEGSGLFNSQINTPIGSVSCKASSTAAPWVLTTLGLLLLVCAFTVMGLQYYRFATYLPAPAHIMKSEVTHTSRRGKVSYALQINYSYVVQGKTYYSDQIKAVTTNTESAKWAGRINKIYPGGSDSTAYYCPQDPNRVFLLREGDIIPYCLLSVGIPLTLVGVMFLLNRKKLNISKQGI